ncbi:MAG TPA: DUF1993 domain-containing protein [Alphaproteobacteria bacterium]|jgi:hypothetical protein|nr:DUF1993 domain-containing protein [Alphaproteobacteria bacterium]
MSLSMYQASVPLFTRQLEAMANILGKAEAHAEARKYDQKALIQARLFPDMLPLSAQIQIASDAAKGAAARLAGIDVPSWEDKEATLEQLKERCTKTVAYLAGFKPEQIDGSEEREVILKIGGNPYPFKGQQYLLSFAIPNFYFHVTTAYALLRHNGVEIGKRDFLNAG